MIVSRAFYMFCNARLHCRPTLYGCEAPRASSNKNRAPGNAGALFALCTFGPLVCYQARNSAGAAPRTAYVYTWLYFKYFSFFDLGHFIDFSNIAVGDFLHVFLGLKHVIFAYFLIIFHGLEVFVYFPAMVADGDLGCF
jgi:hypothetical protein